VPLAKEQFTRTILGNIDHAVLRKRLEGGELTGYELRVADAANLRSGNEPMPPSDSTEASIASVYGDVLGLEPAAVSANSSFFEMGGTSLDVLKLQRELEHRFGNNSIPVGTILHNPVVRELASRVRLGRAGSHNEYHPLVPLQLGGRGTPLFCVHSDDGEVLTFVNLAKYFTDKRPLYALRARGLDAGEKVFSSLAEMVRTYVQAIRERQPRGPYAVAGYGYGGIVAFEIAKDLEAQRERVAFIGSFNQPPYFNRTVMQLETGKSSVARSLQAMGRSYVPSGTVASMSIFYAQPIDSSQRAWLNEELTEWDGLTRLRNRYIQVPGDHHSFIGPKHLSRFQSALQAELERTLGNR
jgi:thioesterase domain-containing protein/acyl carrier protein